MKLSIREQAVVRLVARGLTDKQIAADLSISTNTVRSHLDRVFRRNGLHNRVEAAVAWIHNAAEGSTERQLAVPASQNEVEFPELSTRVDMAPSGDGLA